MIVDLQLLVSLLNLHLKNSPKVINFIKFYNHSSKKNKTLKIRHNISFSITLQNINNKFKTPYNK